jgi:cytochrome c oxidase subunit 2
MVDVVRRALLVRVSTAAAGVGLGLVVLRGIAQSDARVVQVTAKKFTYTPDEVMLKKGEPVVLELKSLDVHMGFKCPDLKLRADIFPEQVTRIPLTVDTAGRYDFYCDVFCGDGHEDMNGTIVVT